jgi:two-component system LytT family sensor kinase
VIARDRSTLSFWHLQAAGWAAYFVMIVVTFLPMVAPGASVWPLVRIKLVRTGLGFALTCVLRLLYRRVEPGRFGQAAALAIPSAVLFGAAWLLLMSVVASSSQELGAVTIVWSKAPREALDYALTLLAWSALYFGVKWARDLQAARAGALEARALAQQAQLEMLRYQLNPHFLFNALNSIRALVDDDRGRAKHMITALSEFLRYPLLGDERGTRPLRDEIDAVRNYLAIEMIRFEGRLHVDVRVDPGLHDVEMPGLLLHPIVENAVKHGMMEHGPLTIAVTACREGDALVITVVNSGRWRSPASNGHADGTGTGLRNVRARLARLGPEAGLDIEEADGRVVARVRVTTPGGASPPAPEPVADTRRRFLPPNRPIESQTPPGSHDAPPPRPAGR